MVKNTLTRRYFPQKIGETAPQSGSFWHEEPKAFWACSECQTCLADEVLADSAICSNDILSLCDGTADNDVVGADFLCLCGCHDANLVTDIVYALVDPTISYK